MESPFNRSTMTSRSPPPPQRRPTEEDSTPATSIIEVVSTEEIQKWISSIEKCLNDICYTSGEGKLNTEQKLRISNTSRNVLGGVSQLAVQYQSLKQKYISAQSMIKTLIDQKESSTALGDQIEDLKVSIRSTPKVEQPNVSFADVLRTSKSSIVRPPSTSNIAIYPASKDKTSEETKKLIQTIIKPEELKLHIRGMRKTRGGGIIISAEGKDDLEKLKKSELLKTSGLNVEETTKRRPKVILLGVPTNTSEKDVFECLYEQNISGKYQHIDRNKFLSSIKLSHKTGKKDGPYCNYVLELTSELRKIFIDQERAYINWTSCPVRDYTLVTRCYKCHQYGHSAKFCRETESTCGHCGCAGHTIKECSKLLAPSTCATCRRFNKPSQHNTGAESCPARKIAEARYMSSINYEGA
ncbi:uncharacterized protein LOC114355216 isoform X2 [Ostrinia furnacalis]|uniref:uncharacterized protein LOC114355216 isoform X1 n=1 Tax=Ostrinia furnacalis TaxID=93504 RepID=UPI00103DD138|nr:uncharacterized protein LOC114355216 isoform X1 [Ostrinia furnacalis]XP_028163726.1 uncharacterized protein LOC114355216 isoform X2 [Ostrinia furnacalis]